MYVFIDIFVTLNSKLVQKVLKEKFCYLVGHEPIFV